MDTISAGELNECFGRISTANRSNEKKISSRSRVNIMPLITSNGHGNDSKQPITRTKNYT